MPRSLRELLRDFQSNPCRMGTVSREIEPLDKRREEWRSCRRREHTLERERRTVQARDLIFAAVDDTFCNGPVSHRVPSISSGFLPRTLLKVASSSAFPLTASNCFVSFCFKSVQCSSTVLTRCRRSSSCRTRGVPRVH